MAISEHPHQIGVSMSDAQAIAIIAAILVQAGTHTHAEALANAVKLLKAADASVENGDLVP